ncbi:peptidylprolyl isomerase [Portibacter marinus]|uniref:peptidylprolyl isomerase n=1 Tax=Portibacter marinus TaxID=2898660 RepID=UPI001F3D5700|nr:peptidylprolyl isomerase [Portibacter marinus]
MSRVLVFIAIVCASSCARPIAKYTITEKENVAPAEVQFENQSENAVQYLWDFGDGNTSKEENPEHKYLLSGQYDVALTAIKKNKKNTTKDKVIVNAPERCLVQLQTEYGNMLIELYESTPKHRDNFLKLVNEGFYDSLLFHRVIDGFMIQGGDPNSRNAGEDMRIGSGGPGYQIDAEILEENLHVKGALAAARQPDSVNPEKKSSGSQFYIVQGDKVTDALLDNVEYRKGNSYTRLQREKYKEEGGYPLLDGDYTVFGKVIEGLDVIDKIAEVETRPGDRPVDNIEMKITVIK